MKGLLQRVRGARVEVEGEVVGAVDQGLLVLVAVEPEDTRASADKLLQKLLNYRVFSDCLLYTSPSPRDGLLSRMPSSA